MKHPVGQTAHLGVTALACVGAQALGEGDQLAQSLQDQPTGNPSTGMHRAELRSVGSSSPDSQKGHTREPDLDVKGERLMWPPLEVSLCASSSRMDEVLLED